VASNQGDAVSEVTRQQLCAALSISESTVRRLELVGLPFTPIGVRGKRYDAAEVKRWLRENGCQSGQTKTVELTSALWSAGHAFTDACRKVQVRGMPSSLKQS
jgi:phage terminase Nu1 subunit (DNA packaging protein)